VAEAGLEQATRKDANLRVKSDVLHDGTTEVVPHFVPSGAVSEPFAAITDDPEIVELVAIASRLPDKGREELIEVARKLDCLYGHVESSQGENRETI